MIFNPTWPLILPTYSMVCIWIDDVVAVPINVLLAWEERKLVWREGGCTVHLLFSTMPILISLNWNLN